MFVTEPNLVSVILIVAVLSVTIRAVIRDDPRFEIKGVREPLKKGVFGHEYIRHKGITFAWIVLDSHRC